MSQQVDAMDFYDTVVDGEDKHKTIALEHRSGKKLEGVEMHVVPKNDLADALHKMPDELFEAAEENELEGEDIEEAAEQMDTNASSALSGDLVDAFEDLCVRSLSHEGLSDVQMRHVIEDFDLETLFDLGSEIINLSIEETGDVRGFQKQS